MQYSSFIYMKFKDRDAWERILGDIKVGVNGEETPLLDFAGEGFFKSFAVFENGALVSEQSLDCLINCGFSGEDTGSFIRAIAEYAGQDILLLGDSFNLSTDPYTQEVYYLGGEVHTTCRTRAAGKHHDLPISDIKAWLGKTRIASLTEEEKAYLKAFSTDRDS